MGTQAQEALFEGVRVVRVALPLLVAAAWVPAERLILVDERLDDADACAAVADVTCAAIEQAQARALAARRRPSE